MEENQSRFSLLIYSQVQTSHLTLTGNVKTTVDICQSFFFFADMEDEMKLRERIGGLGHEER